MSGAIGVGLVGLGKIARDQHHPTIGANGLFRLVATASHDARLDDVPAYAAIGAMIAGEPGLGAVSICTPPRGRFAIAKAAIDADLHVMLEKPPTATMAEILALTELAEMRGVTLFVTWHSREAAGVSPARGWLRDKQIHGARIRWKEDIRRWHPGQEWILETGGFGVFDPGINALSIMTAILPAPLRLEAAQMDIPEGRGSPIAATMSMRCGEAFVSAQFSFLQTGPQIWEIEIDTDAGTLRLAMGGRMIELPGAEPLAGEDHEYPRLYARFAELIGDGKSDTDVRPLQLVADAFLIGKRRTVPAFHF